MIDAYDTRKAMGVFAEKCVNKYQFSRKELDNFALTSLMGPFRKKLFRLQ
ncbi:hypothetical protein [Coxiella-like endosymbiont of Rhipicephalus sanguineus]|nr:hypothetical protein [Coxiella-like endosymbiont of Rhipicephalus sanguineus]